MRPNKPPSKANVNNIHHQEHLRTLTNFNIININVSIFDSFCLTQYDYILFYEFLQSTFYNARYKKKPGYQITRYFFLFHWRETIIANFWATYHPSIPGIGISFPGTTTVFIWAFAIWTCCKKSVPV